MKRIWNLQTKIVALLVVLLLGSFVLQTVVHDYSKERLLREVVSVATELADEVSESILAPIAEAREVPRPRVTILRVRGPGASQKMAYQVPNGRMMFLDLSAVQRSIARAAEEYGRRHLPVDDELTQELLDLFRPDEHFERRVLAQRFAPSIPAVSASPFSEPPRSSLAELSSPDARIPLSPYTERLQKIFEDSKRFDLMATVGIFLLGIALAWILGVRLTRPMAQIVEGFQHVADGHLEHRVAVTSGGEFAFLGDQFNRMVDGLEENRQLERELSQRERVQHMGDLAAGVAHDVRNPLNAIHLHMGQIRDEFVPKDERSQQRFLRFTGDVQREVERLNEIVTSFLSLAQPSSTDVELLQPNELVLELTRLLEKEASGRKVRLRVDVDENLPHLYWNRQEMKSALLNVAINSLQSVGPDGGAVDVITGVRGGDADPELGGGEDQEVAITFVDTGCGISELNLDRIFIPYFTTRKGGTGLGMAVSRRIVERNGGRIEVRSRLGEGTSVSFIFPTPGEGEQRA